MKKTILIATGGSGGHIYPAEAVAEELSQEMSVSFIGGGLDKNPYFQRDLFPYTSLKAENFKRNAPFRFFWCFLHSFFKSYRYIRKYRPAAVVGFGTIFSLPALLAAKCAGCPVILHEANSRPGKVVRLLSPYVDRVALHFPDAKKRLRGSCTVCPMPLRQRLLKGAASKEQALAYFGLKQGRKTLLVIGGSQGALFINRVVEETLSSIFLDNLQIVHLTGKDKGIEEIKTAYAKLGIPNAVKEFEDRIDLAWTVADFAISRAGGSSIAEQIEHSVPGILIPYPYAENHQEYNADHFVNEIGGGIKLLQNEATAITLGSAIKSLLQNYEQFVDNLESYKRKTENNTLAKLIKETING